MNDISEADWNSLIREEHSPFLEYHWLYACEASGSMVVQTGWQTCHVLGFRSEADAQQYRAPVFILPLYLKSHSWGEFVFDFQFVNLFEGIGKQYFPKAVGVIPATPVTAYDCLFSSEPDVLAESAGTSAGGVHAQGEARKTSPKPSAYWERYEQVLGQAIAFIEKQLISAGVRSLSFLYAEEHFAQAVEKMGFRRWVHQGFEWRRGGRASFDDYIAGFRKNQRKNIRRERRSLAEEGLRIRRYSGEALNEHIALDMFALYDKTNAQFGPWAAKFFNEEFFLHVFRHFSHRILVLSAESASSAGKAEEASSVSGAESAGGFSKADSAGSAETSGSAIARSMLIQKNSALYGRYWGCHSFVKFLHFNLCYYEPIDIIINEGLERFDPGLGGEHKAIRGFASQEVYSMHHFFDPDMDAIFATNIERVNAYTRAQITALNEGTMADS